MSNIFRLFLIVFIVGSGSAIAQQIKKDDNKVQIFTYEEKANLQNWYREEAKRMQLTEDQEANYSSILVYYVAKIARLDDKDQMFTKEEFKKELNKYLVKQEAELKEILSPEQFEIHQEIYAEFMRSAKRRWGIED